MYAPRPMVQLLAYGGVLPDLRQVPDPRARPDSCGACHV